MTEHDDGQPSPDHDESSTGHDDIIDAEVVELSEPQPIEADETESKDRQAHDRHLPVRRDTGARDWADYAEPQRQCRAHKKTGEQCKNAAILGSTVCRYHGGAAEHVKRAARARIENATDLVAKELISIALSGDSDATRVTAIKDLLDRGGLKAPSEVVLSAGHRPPYEDVFEDISSGSRAESRARRGLDPAEDGGLNRSASGLDVSLHDQGDKDRGGDQAVDESYWDTNGSDGNVYTSDGGLSGRVRPDFDRRDDRPGLRRFGREHAAEDAVAAANRANARAVGQRAIESPHKRYPRS
jgi:hypothetical protein